LCKCWKHDKLTVGKHITVCNNCKEATTTATWRNIAHQTTGSILDIFISNFQGKVLIPEKVKEEVCSGREEAPRIVTLIENEKIKVLKVKKH
jgi:hypothetical protein